MLAGPTHAPARAIAPVGRLVYQSGHGAQHPTTAGDTHGFSRKTTARLSPQEVLPAAQSYAPGLGIATVYRNVKALLEEGWLESVSPAR